MIFYGLNAKPQTNREKYGWTCQQCGKRTHKSKQLTHEMMFKLLSKGIVAKTRGYTVCNNAGFGGSGKYSDKNLLDLILTNDEEALARDQGARNLISFFGLTKGTQSEHALVVDRGFEGCKQEFLTLIAPKGKHKSLIRTF